LKFATTTLTNSDLSRPPML